jgi:hypothetical protein
MEFFHVTAEGWAECGGEDCFSVGRDVVLDLLDRFRQLLDQTLARSSEPLEMPAGKLQVLDRVADEFHFFETAKPGSL